MTCSKLALGLAEDFLPLGESEGLLHQDSTI